MIAFSQKDLTSAFAEHAVRESDVYEAKGAAAERIALFGIHGISPIQRYAFQDQVALAFRSYLNAFELRRGSGRTWNTIVHWPHVAEDSGSGDGDSVRPTALRLYRDDDDPETPKNRVYDVYEGYWSPLSKGKTNIASALRWLLNATFLGTSSTARIPCERNKLLSDVSYLAVIFMLALLACVVAIVLGLVGWLLLAQMLPEGTAITYAEMLANPIGSALRLPSIIYWEFILDLIIGYLVAQIIVVYRLRRQRDARTKALSNDVKKGGTFQKKTIGAHAFHAAILWILWIAFAFFVIAAILLAMFFGQLLTGSPLLAVGYTVVIALAVAATQYARSKADFAVENVLGDVQVYTTHDNNAIFYDIRQQIILTVAGSLRKVLGAVNPKPAGISSMLAGTDSTSMPYYDKIHILAHSLGSTIGMDILIYLRQMVEEGSMASQQWNNIRSFTTFGTSLEKTRFFFDVRQPTLNAAQDQWANDVYGRFFTNDRAALQFKDKDGIYWSNHWYFRDIVANAIVSYESDVKLGAQFKWGPNTMPICKDYEIPHDRPRFAWVHSDYLADPLFWVNAGPVLTS